MRGTKAKALRRATYGINLSHREREYLEGHKPQMMFTHEVLGVKVHRKNPTCICTGARRAYQDSK